LSAAEAKPTKARTTARRKTWNRVIGKWD